MILLQEVLPSTHAFLAPPTVSFQLTVTFPRDILLRFQSRPHLRCQLQMQVTTSGIAGRLVFRPSWMLTPASGMTTGATVREEVLNPGPEANQVRVVASEHVVGIVIRDTVREELQECVPGRHRVLLLLLLLLLHHAASNRLQPSSVSLRGIHPSELFREPESAVHIHSNRGGGPSQGLRLRSVVLVEEELLRETSPVRLQTEILKTFPTIVSTDSSGEDEGTTAKLEDEVFRTAELRDRDPGELRCQGCTGAIRREIPTSPDSIRIQTTEFPELFG